jgi:hypothetical protein
MKATFQRRNGFTLLDVTTASILTAVLAVMLSSTWARFSRPTSSLVAWGQLFQEMDLAVASLARDLGGGLPDDQTGNKQQGLLVGCTTTHDLNGDHLKLSFSATSTDDVTIDYYVDGVQHTLMRQLQRTNPTTHVTTTAIHVVASNVESTVSGANGLIVDDDPNDANNLRIRLTFTFHFPGESGGTYWMAPLSRTCVLIVKKQP